MSKILFVGGLGICKASPIKHDSTWAASSFPDIIWIPLFADLLHHPTRSPMVAFKTERSPADNDGN
jgi:hypothetical protein